MELREAIEKRRSIRKFKNKSCRASDILTILDSAIKAPCAGGIFSVRMILVEDKKMKARLREAALDQEQVEQASHVIVVCSDPKATEKMYGKFAKKAVTQQAGAAIENMLLTATSLGLGSCYVGGFDDNAVKRLLQVPESLDVEALVAIGYSDERPRPKSKPALKAIVKMENYSQKPMKDKRIDS